MVNRVLQQKRIKMRRKHRHAVFTEAKVMKTKDDPLVTYGKLLGNESLSKQVIGYGLRVPGRQAAKYSLNKEAMSQINPRKELVRDIPKTLGLSIEREQAERLAIMLNDQEHLEMHHRLIDGKHLKVFCFYPRDLKFAYLIEINYRRMTVTRSINYSSVSRAQEVLLRGTVEWKINRVEIISPE